jgi:DNA-binding NarL/FixJ family response regulator
MPARSGLEILEEIKTIQPKLPVLILSMHPEEQYAVRTLRAGAAGYLTKASAPQELISAIRKVSKGGKYVTSSLAENWHSNWIQGWKNRITKNSPTGNIRSC